MQVPAHLLVRKACVRAILVALLAPELAAANPTVVLQVNDTSPDGAPYRTLHRPESAGGGAVAFSGRTVFPNRGNYLEPGGTALVIRGEFLAGPGVTVRRWSRPAANANGDTVWQARVSGNFGSGIFSSLSLADTVVVTKGQDSGDGFVFTEFERPVVSDNGSIVFHADLLNEMVPAVTERLYRCYGGDYDCRPGGGGTLEKLVQVGDTYSGATREICDLSEQIDASNWGIGFRAQTAPAGACGGARDETVLRKPYVGAIVAIATEGDAAPVPLGSQYFRFDGPPEIDNQGDIAVLAETAITVREVIYFCDSAMCPGSPPQAVIVQSADDGDGNLLTRFKAVGMSDADHVVFQAVSTSTTEKRLSIYVARAPTWTLERVAANMDVTVDPMNLGEYRRIGRPSMSSDGYVVFESILKNAGNRFTLWAYDLP